MKTLTTLVLLLVALGLAAQAKPDPSKAAIAPKDGLETSNLANGIPVIFKANPNNKVLTIQASLKGGSALLTPETAGWEGLALTMLTRGSSRFTYAQLKDLQWRSSSTLAASPSGFDASTFNMVCLPGSLDQVFDAWSDAFLHPRWDAAEFDRVLQEARMALQQSQQDPFGRAVTELHHGMFVGHPYRSDFTPTAESLDAASLVKVKQWWENNLKSGRITLIAVGDFDFPALKKKLDRTFGSLPKIAATIPDIPAWTTSGQAFVVPFADAGAVGYVRADFAIPAVTDPDFDVLNLGFTILDDILFDVVRAKYGACYSVWARSFGFLAPYGSLVVYKSDRPGKVRPYLDEAIGLLASGKALASQASASAAGKSGLGAAPESHKSDYVDLNQVLAFYKAKAINSFYEEQQTNGAIASQIAWAQLYTGNPRSYLDFATRVNAVKAADVVRVIKKYVQEAPKSWVVLASPDVLDGLTPEEFAR